MGPGVAMPLSERNSEVVDYRLIKSKIDDKTTDNELSLTQILSTLMKHLPSIMYNCVTVRYRRIGLLGACAKWDNSEIICAT